MSDDFKNVNHNHPRNSLPSGSPYGKTGDIPMARKYENSPNSSKAILRVYTAKYGYFRYNSKGIIDIEKATKVTNGE